jgi:hypothetical protein
MNLDVEKLIIMQQHLRRIRLLSFKNKDRIETDAPNDSSIIACIFIPALMFFFSAVA